jgi:hypothetical protein
MGLLHGRAGRLTTKNDGFRPPLADAILCMNVYGGALPGYRRGYKDGISERDNFDDFFHAMCFLIQIFTGQEFMFLVFSLDNADAIAPFTIIGSYSHGPLSH